MLKKHYTRTGRTCRVTFRLAPQADAEAAALCGDFNDWEQHSLPMKALKDGGFSTTISLPAGQSYRFRYVLDGTRWENDDRADAYLPNDFGSDDGIVTV